jgi:prepilin-type N-terminal cleavage/methylation domain-containing protein
MQTGKLKSGGMTLVETLVVVSILGVFMAIAIPSVMQSFTLISQVKKTTVRYPNARKALGRISDKIRQTYPIALESGAPFVGESTAIEAGDLMLPSDELSFMVLDTGYSHVRSAHKISYRLDLDPEKGETLRGLIEERSFVGAVEGAGMEETVPGSIVGLDFRYLDDSTEPAEWVDEWPSAAGDSNVVPAAVRITIFVLGEISPEPKSFTTVVNVPAQ